MWIDWTSLKEGEDEDESSILRINIYFQVYVAAAASVSGLSWQDSEDFTVYIKNSVAFPHFGEQFRKNNLPGQVWRF